jgi:hypothetical protein
MVAVRINAWIQLVGNICVVRTVVGRIKVRVVTRVKFVTSVSMMRTIVGRSFRYPTVVEIRVIAGIELIRCIGAVRAVVCRTGSVAMCGCGAMICYVSVRVESLRYGRVKGDTVVDKKSNILQ